MKRCISLCLAVSFLAVAGLCHAQGGARVESFSPQGTIKTVRQVTARFSEPMTTFGDPRNVPPFDVSCPETGSGRWADVRNWVFDFDRDLPGGVLCSFRVREGLKTLAGSSIGGPAVFSFSTGGPAILTSRPRSGNTIAEDQIFVLNLDAEADEASVVAKTRFSIEGIAESIGVTIVKGAERTAVLKAIERPDAANTLTLRCRQTFPSKAKVKLIWGAGIASKSGVAASKDQILTFTVRDPFLISFQCERLNADAPCLPVVPMQLNFSAPVPVKMAKNIVMKSGNKIYKPQLQQDAEEGADTAQSIEVVQGVYFKGPFPERKSFSIELPKSITDDAGRRPANQAKFPLHVATDGFSPLAKFAAPFGIVELNADATMPVTLRNIEPNVQLRRLKSDEPTKHVEFRVKEAVETVVDKARAVGDKARATGDRLAAWITGSNKPQPEAIKTKSLKMSADSEERIIQWLPKIRRARRYKPLLGKSVGADEFVLPKPNGGKAFEVVGIPLRTPGFHIVEVESPILGAALLDKPRPMYVSSAALVTNMSAHFKWGRESSLVWVTSLDKGLPVAGAEVHIRDCNGKLHWQGKTDSDGIARIKSKLSGDLPQCEERQEKDKQFDGYSDNAGPMLQGIDGGLFVFARKQGDLTFVHSSWDKGIEGWRFQLPYSEFKEHTLAHTVFDRSLLRAGETLHMKHFMRTHVMNGFDLRKVTDLPKTAIVMHRGSEQRYQFPLSWKADNSAETKMTVPKGAELGFYDVYLVKGSPAANDEAGENEEAADRFNPYDAWQSGSFRVEEFRIPLMKGVIEPPKEPAVNASSLEVDLYVSYLSGGGAGGAPVKLRTQIKPRPVSFDDYENYTFSNGKVETGVKKAESFERSYDEEDAANLEVQPKEPTYRSRELVLDKTGALRVNLDDLPKIAAPHTMLAELEFYDPNGELQTVTGRFPLWSSKLLVGVKPETWAATPESLNFKTAVVDLKGRATPGAKVQVELFQRKHFSHRKRLVGGFYSYEQVTETKAMGPICQGITDSLGLFTCSSKSPVSGNVILQATVIDDAGNSSTANQDVWVAGKGEWWFEAADSDRIDLLPEKKVYNAGDTAKFQVRSPFRSATVLVTVEREGIIDAYVKKVSGKQPVISVPIKGKHAPNVFVSALCVRGRVAGSKPTALFDPGKPAYRLGISEIKVGHKEHELKVKVTSDSDTYKVRSKAKIKIKVASAAGGSLPKGAEVAVAAVDEGLLELMPNDSWKLLDAMMGRRGYEVNTSTAQTQIIGRRHYGLKALPAGGGGGMRSTRELFDAVLAWKGRVKLDAKGEATLEIPLNDSLTSFSVVAVASAGTGLFGTGRTTIRTSQELMLLSGLPPLVRQGDRFTARFTARNASSRQMSIVVSAKPSWSDGSAFQPVTLSLGPGEAKDVTWPAEAPVGIESATWDARAKEEKGDGADRVKASQKVVAAVPVRVYQATVAQVHDNFDLQVKSPDDAVKGRGGVNVVMKARLADGLAGVSNYLKNYPYSCMEQMTSRAIGLKDDALWKQVVTVLPSYLDANGLVKYFPSQYLEGSTMLTAYLLSISKEAGRELPEYLIEAMDKGLTAFAEGKIRRESNLLRADLSIQKLAAVEALSRRRAVNHKLLASVALEPDLWPTSALLDWVNILKRTQDFPKRSERLKQAEQILRSRLNFQGTTMNFSTERSDRLWWLMVSADTNALRTVLTFLDERAWRDDMPRLVRGALARQQHGSWDTTISNAWGVLAIDKFSKQFEAVAVTGQTKAEMGGSAKSVDWGKEKKGKALLFPWPEGSAKMSLHHVGAGRPWATVMSMAAIPLKAPLSSGYRIGKTVVPVEQRDKSRWSRGDVVRVRLEIEAQSDMTWVAVNDPIPAGSTILGSGLGRDSALMVQGERSRSWPVYEERGFDAYRAYYDYVPKGKFVTEYTVRFNNEGNFHLPPSRVEALYSPEMFGETPNRPLKVGE